MSAWHSRVSLGPVLYFSVSLNSALEVNLVEGLLRDVKIG